MSDESRLQPEPEYRALVSLHLPNFSPPATSTVVYDNGVQLPNHVGNGLGVGGPDLTTVNERGDRVYGYQSTITSFGFWNLILDDQGLTGNPSAPSGSPLGGFNVGRIEAALDLLFTDRGEIIDLNTYNQIGSFSGGGNFVVDPTNHRLYSTTSSGSTHTLYAYNLDQAWRNGVHRPAQHARRRSRRRLATLGHGPHGRVNAPSRSCISRATGRSVRASLRDEH